MIDESIITYLNKIDGGLNFKSLINFMSDSLIIFKDRRIKGPIGMTTPYCIYLDIKRVDELNLNPMTVYFLVLHEIGHYKRIKNMGKETMLNHLSTDNFDELCYHIVNEEIFCDRYASLLFYHFNKLILPKIHTQQLDNEIYRLMYRQNVKPLFGVIQNKEENYMRLIESFLL